ncbi:MAG: hypothetical protein BWK76_10555 [Desulfobulbaceae bacterium A2]|nr:MAG: hypothetical protein BWK76_10555 [Desulfobulbaceae bacterium A2]
MQSLIQPKSATPRSNPIDSPSPRERWFFFQQDRLVVCRSAESLNVPATPSDISGTDHAPTSFIRKIGELSGEACYVAELTEFSELSETSGLQGITLREAFAHLAEDLWGMAGRAFQILAWHRNHRFCGRCGARTTELATEFAMRCPRCELLVYPRISPAVIMTVLDGDKILLGRAPRFPAGMYSPLAGFVEPGETLEEAVRREVQEEVGIAIDEIRYVGNQPWPFPHSLMIGFTARYAGGDLQVNHNELEDAQWFTADRMPLLPARTSIARRLIELYLAEHVDSAA